MSRVAPESSGLRRRGGDTDEQAPALQVPKALATAFERLDCFAVKQDVEYFEAVTGIETENSYQVMGACSGRPSWGPTLAKESSGFFARMLCGSRRPWTICLGGPDAVLVVQRPFRWLLPECTVLAGGNGHTLGSVKRSCRGWPFQRNFTIRDQWGEPELEITCPFLSFGWNFTIRDMDGEELGKISKKIDFSARGFAQELFTDADNFGVQFPESMSAAKKALLLGAVFLIDFCFFEDNEMQRSGRRGNSRGRSF